MAVKGYGLIDEAELATARAEILQWLAHNHLFKSCYTVEQAEALALMLVSDRMNRPTSK